MLNEYQLTKTLKEYRELLKGIKDYIDSLKLAVKFRFDTIDTEILTIKTILARIETKIDALGK